MSVSADLTAAFCQFSWASDEPHSNEVFTDSMIHEIGETGDVTVYVTNRIVQLARVLSKNLPSDPEKAKQEHLRRFHAMDGMTAPA